MAASDRVKRVRKRDRDRARSRERRRMCEQQRCISVQRSIHRVEVNARPYSGPRKEREVTGEGIEGLEVGEGRHREQALSGKNEQTFRKTRKGMHGVLVHYSSLPFLCFVLTFINWRAKIYAWFGRSRFKTASPFLHLVFAFRKQVRFNVCYLRFFKI